MKLAYFTGLLLIITPYIDECNCENHDDVTKRGNYKSRDEQRQILVKNIITKMTNLSFYSFVNVSEKETPKIMNLLRSQLKSASNFSEPHRRDRYVELLMDGIQSIISSKNNVGALDSIINTNVGESYNQAVIKKQVLRSGSENYISSEELDPSDTNKILDDGTCDCSCVEEKLCMKISSLNTFACVKNQTTIPLVKLCNGENNCRDNSDEDQCRLHANTKLSNAKRIIKEITKLLPKYCLEVQNSEDKVVMKIHNTTLTKVLETQMGLLSVVAPIKLHKKSAKPIKQVNEITRIVSSVGAALEGALCIRDIRRSGLPSVDDNAHVMNMAPRRPWAPPLCTCNGQFCLQNNCTVACNTTCWQRYTLSQWTCQAVGGAHFVSLNHICDGRVDCMDESDEQGCTAGAGADKFQATQTYNSIIELLANKIASNPQMYNFIYLQESVKTLQAQSTLAKPDADTVKQWRDECFSGLLTIFDGILSTAANVIEVDTGYDFLMSVSHKLVEAMKRSKTGNGRLFSSNECHCVRDKCLLTECTDACVRSCAVKDTISEYSCKGNSGATTVAKNICNGKKDCPEGDDEENCEREVCRKHHLLVLRNKLQNYKNNRWRKALGEVLDIWKNKTIATILAAEDTNRTTRRDLEHLLAESLHDLVQTYGTLPTFTRRSSDGALPAFLEMSRLVQDTFRSCTV